jgi:cyclase
MIRFSRTAPGVASAALLLGAYLVHGRDTAAQTSTPGAAYRFQQIQPGIYSAIGTGTVNVGANSAIIINQNDVMVVDSHISPESMRVLARELKTITDKPVRYVVNTHFHYDHSNGNQIFGPEVEVIGHEFTRKKLLGDVLHEPTYANAMTALSKQIADFPGRIEAEKNPAAKARLQEQFAVQRAYQESQKELKPTPPNVTFDDRLTLVRGGREIQLYFFGRGHTGGDVVVMLPKERLLCTGDLLTAGLSFMGDAYVDRWADTLEKVKALDFDDVIPGHGEPFKGKEKFGSFQAYLRDAWQQASKLHSQGVSAADAAKQIDMTSHKAHYPNIAAPGLDPVVVTRMYDVMDGKAER